MKNYLFKLGKQAKKASIEALKLKKKNQVLKDYCNLLLKNRLKIISENRKDLKKAEDKKLKENLIKRLLIDQKKIFDVISSIKTIIKFAPQTGPSAKIPTMREDLTRPSVCYRRQPKSSRSSVCCRSDENVKKNHKEKL